MIIHKKIAVMVAILTLGYSHLNGMECNTTLVGKCKTAGNAFHGCLKTKYKTVYDGLLKDFLSGENISFVFFNEDRATGKPLPNPYISYNGAKIANDDPNCLEKLKRLSDHVDFLDGKTNPILLASAQKNALNFADVFSQNDISARKVAIENATQQNKAIIAAQRQARLKKEEQRRQQQYNPQMAQPYAAG
ncbi:MAG: hypothetical protein HEEMFOPI_01240 [Holosporales bacterium]